MTLVANERRDFKPLAAEALLTAKLTAVGLVFPVSTVSGWGDTATKPYLVVIDANKSTQEIVRVPVGGLVGTTITLSNLADRGLGGTVAVEHQAGATVQPMWTNIDADELNLLVSRFGSAVALFTDPMSPIYGATGDNATDDLAALQAAATASINGPPLIINRAYEINGGPLVLAGNQKVVFGPLGQIRQATAGQAAIKVTGSRVTLENPKVRGVQFAAQQLDEIGIWVLGASAAAPVTDFKCIGADVATFGGMGILLEWVDGFTLNNPKTYDCYYSGIHGYSVLNGRVNDVDIDNIIGAPLAYGIAFTARNSNSQVTEPPSTDITVKGGTITRVTNWEGLDTHGGVRVRFDGITLYGCARGGLIGASANAANDETYPPVDCHIDNCLMDSGLTNGTALHGIFIGGAQRAGVNFAYAKGCGAHGNVIRGYGLEGATASGGIVCDDTDGVSILGNKLIECSPNAVVFNRDNKDFICDNTLVTDVWSTAVATPTAVFVATRATGTIGIVTVSDSSKVAAALNERGVSISNVAGNDVRLSGQIVVPAGKTPLVDTGNKASTKFVALTTTTFAAPIQSTRVVVSDAAGTGRQTQYQTAGVLRWDVGATSTAEGGANAGSDFRIRAYDDAGVSIGDAFSIERATRKATFTGGDLVLATGGKRIVMHTAAETAITEGAGSPEGVITAPPGSLYMNRSGGAGTSLYVKESGVGDTGWVAK